MQFNEISGLEKTENEEFYLKTMTPKYRYLPMTIFGVILVLIIYIFTYTANSSLPGDLSYPLDLFMEKSRVIFSKNQYNKISDYYNSANERFVEYQIVNWENKIYGDQSNHDLNYAKKETLNATDLASIEIDLFINKNSITDNEINKNIVLMKKKLEYIKQIIMKNNEDLQIQKTIKKSIKNDNGTINHYFELID